MKGNTVVDSEGGMIKGFLFTIFVALLLIVFYSVIDAFLNMRSQLEQLAKATEQLTDDIIIVEEMVNIVSGEQGPKRIIQGFGYSAGIIVCDFTDTLTVSEENCNIHLFPQARNNSFSPKNEIQGI